MSNNQKKLTCADIERLECVCHGKLSPDGNKLAYLADVLGVWQIFVTDAMVGNAGAPVTELECGVADYYWA